jgi:transcriptional antiterminator Rof (Rho-off)
MASADLVLEFAERDLAKAQELEAHGNDHDRRADEASDRYKCLPGLAAACDAKDHAELAAEARRQARERLESAERLAAMARAIRERAEARHEAFLATARQNRVIRSRATHAPQRSTREPRRRASRSAAAATRAGPAKGDDPDPEPSSRVLVCQKTAPAVLGWTGRRYIDFLRRKRVPHVVDARLFVAKLDDVLTALGLDAPSAAKVEAIVDWRARAELKLVGGSRGGR